MRRGVVLRHAANDIELDRIGTVDAKLRRRERHGHVREQLAHRLALGAEDLQQPHGRVRRVVEAGPPVGEEHVPAHLPREERAFFLHLRLDERVPRLPHDGLPAVLRDVGVERRRALHLAEHLGARVLAQHAAREEDQQLVAPHDVAVLVDGAEAIPVAVPRDPDVGPDRLHPRLERLQVLGHGRIGVVVRERPVDVAEQRIRRKTKGPQRRDAERPGRPVARVDDDPQIRPRHARRRLHARDVLRRHVARLDAAPGHARGVVGARLDAVRELLDVRAEERSLSAHHLEAVVGRRVVARGDHHRPVRPQVVRREVEERRRPDPDVRHARAAVHEPLRQRGEEPIRRQPTVPRDSHGERRPGGQFVAQGAREGAPEGGGEVIGQVTFCDAADVVFAEDGAGHDHGNHEALVVLEPRPGAGADVWSWSPCACGSSMRASLTLRSVRRQPRRVSRMLPNSSTPIAPAPYRQYRATPQCPAR